MPIRLGSQLFIFNSSLVSGTASKRGVAAEAVSTGSPFRILEPLRVELITGGIWALWVIWIIIVYGFPP